MSEGERHGGRLEETHDAESAAERTHELRRSRPEFLDLLDRNPARAQNDFYVYLVKLMKAAPPSLYWAVPLESREEVVNELWLHMVVDEFRRLRSYRDQGRAFAAWFSRVARNWIADWLERHGRRAQVEVQEARDADDTRNMEPPDPASGTEEMQWSQEVVEIARRCLGRMSALCRTLLQAAEEGLTPAEMTLLIGKPADRNKEVGTTLARCRQTLKRLLFEEQIDIDAILGRRSRG